MSRLGPVGLPRCRSSLFRSLGGICPPFVLFIPFEVLLSCLIFFCTCSQLLAFFGHSSPPVHAPAASAAGTEPDPELEEWFEDWVNELVDNAFYDEPSEIVQKLQARNQADIDDLLSIPTTPQPVDWDSVTPTQARAFARLHNIPISTRGRISAATIVKLKEAA